MAKTDDIEHCCRMIAAHTDLDAYDIVRFVSKLEGVARDGGYITPITEEAETLKNTVNELRNLADRIVLVRESLLQNERSQNESAA